ELARPLLFGAALASQDTRARDVSAAKVACTDAAYRAARTALQVHGAIGYTAEYDLSLWLTKVRALVSAWGTQRFHRDRVLTAVRREHPIAMEPLRSPCTAHPGECSRRQHPNHGSSSDRKALTMA